MHEVHDHYFHQAKREGYLSRAAFKLIEIDDRRTVLKRASRVLDCGAAPGSWLQVASKRVGGRGVVVGIDLQPIARPAGLGNVHIIQGDFTKIEPSVLLEPIGADRLFDVVLSDMAPSTTGNRAMDHHRSVRLVEALLDRCPALLALGGHLVAKVFEGEAYPGLLERCRACFDDVKGFSPKASRGTSTEMFVVAKGYRGAPEKSPDEAELPKRKPSRGWG
ncbi:MAG: RlmE family RNA methyltransferase [Planctomycetes bacterium]|nr:RlmE family RNA methyltransferase [Planctomycetota bacterium]